MSKQRDSVIERLEVGSLGVDGDIGGLSVRLVISER